MGQQEEIKPSVGTEKEIPSSESQKAIDLPMTEACDAWMDDGDTVGFIEDDDDDVEEKTKEEEANEKKAIDLENEPQVLSLEAPSYSSIASKPKPTVFEDENISEPPAIIEAKCPTKETLIFVEEKDSEGEIDRDEEGFEISITRKHRRERKSSKRLSQSCDEAQVDVQSDMEQSLDKEPELREAKTRELEEMHYD